MVYNLWINTGKKKCCMLVLPNCCSYAEPCSVTFRLKHVFTSQCGAFLFDTSRERQHLEIWPTQHEQYSALNVFLVVLFTFQKESPASPMRTWRRRTRSCDEAFSMFSAAVGTWGARAQRPQMFMMSNC